MAVGRHHVLGDVHRWTRHVDCHPPAPLASLLRTSPSAPRGTGTRAHLREEKKAARSLSDAPTDVLRWHVELHDTARDLKAELDSKITALQVLIRMAGHEAARLERLIESAESHSRDEDT